jgi:hypothetical protein
MEVAVTGIGQDQQPRCRVDGQVRPAVTGEVPDDDAGRLEADGDVLSEESRLLR